MSGLIITQFDDFGNDEQGIEFQTSELPGCCGVVVVHDFDFFVTKRADSKVLAKIRAGWKDVLKNERVGLLTCTTTTFQAELNAVLDKTGWIRGKAFKNPNTGNRVQTWTFTARK